MKKTILALALAAGLTSFAGSAKANLINIDFSFTGNVEQATYDSVNGWKSKDSFSPTATVSGKIIGVDPTNTEYSQTVEIDSISGLKMTSPLIGSVPWSRSLHVYDPTLAAFSVGYNSVSSYYNLVTIESNGPVENYGWLDAYLNSENSLIALNSIGYWGVTRLVLYNADSFFSGLDKNTFLRITDPYSPGDTLTYSYSGTAAVPESSQVAASLLLVVGIAGFVIVRRRQALVA